MTREQIKIELNGYGFAYLEDDLRETLLEEINSGYELLSLEEVKLYQEKCWFEKEAVLHPTKEGKVFYFVPRKYL